MNLRVQTIRLRPCPKCKSGDVRFMNLFDFKYMVACLECGEHTQWHLHNPMAAIEEWNEGAGQEDL